MRNKERNTLGIVKPERWEALLSEYFQDHPPIMRLSDATFSAIIAKVPYTLLLSLTTTTTTTSDLQHRAQDSDAPEGLLHDYLLGGALQPGVLHR